MFDSCEACHKLHVLDKLGAARGRLLFDCMAWARLRQIFGEGGVRKTPGFRTADLHHENRILCDSVSYRETGARKKDEQPFSCASLLEKIPNAEHEQAQGLLNQVIDTAAKGGLAYSEFQRQAPDAMKRIELGLKARQNINVGEDGAISE